MAESSRIMPDVEPAEATAVRAAVAHRLGLATDQIDLLERTVPGSQVDEPPYVTLLIPEGVDRDRIEAALQAVQEQMWQHPAYPTQLRWDYKP